jgi:serine beta-lactamase-like protein LACTB, mitochondrial
MMKGLNMVVTRRILLSFPAAAWAQEAASRWTPEKANAVRQTIEAEMVKRKIPGLTIAVAHRDRVVWEEAFGLADLENSTPVKTNSRFRLASLSKPLTAVAVLHLVEQKKIALDAEIRTYVDAFPAKAQPVTVRQLLGHLGGVRSYRDREIESTRHYDDVFTPLSIFANDPLIQQPGTKYSYTTYGYNLLGAAVQHASGMSYVDYVRQNVLTPAGMKLVVPDDHFAIVEGRVRGYLRRKDGSVVNAALADTSNKIPGGGWLGTAGDMAAFAIAFRQCKLTSRETVTLMLRTQRTVTGVPTGYGMGWQIFRYADPKIAPEKRIVGHTGSQPGTNTFLGMTMDAAWTVALLTNLEGGTPQTIAEPVFEILR